MWRSIVMLQFYFYLNSRWAIVLAWTLCVFMVAQLIWYPWHFWIWDAIMVFLGWMKLHVVMLCVMVILYNITFKQYCSPTQASLFLNELLISQHQLTCKVVVFSWHSSFSTSNSLWYFLRFRLSMILTCLTVVIRVNRIQLEYLY